MFSRYGYGFGYYMDPTYILVIIGMLLCVGASVLVNRTMAKYSKIRNSRNITGAEAAQMILRREGLTDVRVMCLSSNSGDHYDPRSKTLRLSQSNYHSQSVTAVGVAAHECGHAIQHAHGYVPLKVRGALVPAANVGNYLGIPLVFLGIILSWNPLLIQIGIWIFSIAVLFQIVTLPVEINASRRAVAIVENYDILSREENQGCKKVLTAAALTYVAAAASSVLQLLRLLLISGNGRGRRD
jgi:Zn-dependent membrane protease YugP